MSGSSLNKPLVTAFRSNNGEYVVLDNEMNGTMGLPIILVSKLVNNSLVAVPDEEWNAVKEVLRLIIAGNQVDYINVGETIGAEEMFFKQLTLPLASFEALKNNYHPVNANVQEAPIAPEVVSVGESSSKTIEPTIVTPQVENVTPIETPVPPVEPASTVPTPEPVAPEVVAPVMPSTPISQNVAEVVAPTPAVEPIPEVTESVPVDFTADKEAFLKACENMFDALVAKFNK